MITRNVPKELLIGLLNQTIRIRFQCFPLISNYTISHFNCFNLKIEIEFIRKPIDRSKVAKYASVSNCSGVTNSLHGRKYLV